MGGTVKSDREKERESLVCPTRALGEVKGVVMLLWAIFKYILIALFFTFVLTNYSILCVYTLSLHDCFLCFSLSLHFVTN